MPVLRGVSLFRCQKHDQFIRLFHKKHLLLPTSSWWGFPTKIAHFTSKVHCNRIQNGVGKLESCTFYFKSLAKYIHCPMLEWSRNIKMIITQFWQIYYVLYTYYLGMYCLRFGKYTSINAKTPALCYICTRFGSFGIYTYRIYVCTKLANFGPFHFHMFYNQAKS